MRRSLMFAAVAWLALGLTARAASLDGTWEITAVIDNGEVFSTAKIKEQFAKDARLTFSGQQITFTRPSGGARTLLFVTDSKARPATFDLGGAEKTDGKGIYLLSDDTLMVCLSGPGVKDRPTAFTSKEGTHALLMTLQRVKAPAARPPAPPVKTVPAGAAKGGMTEAEMRKKLVGTWGAQTADAVEYHTLNADGSFSSSKQWKRAIKKLFDDEERSSGT